MKQLILVVILFATFNTSHANIVNREYLPKDTLYTELKNDIVIVSSTKETNSLRSLPAAVSVFSPKNLEAMQIHSLKDLSSFVPNYSVADYGSKMTAPIYIRGVGARSGTQTVSMYVDNIPYFNTTSFDVELMDIQRVEVLRGTQSTLYGRNAMGGILNVYTYSPLAYEGIDMQIGGGTYGQFSTKLSHYKKLSNSFGASASVYYKQNDGYFENDHTGRRIDNLKNGGARTKFAWNIAPQLSLNFSIGFDYLDQGAFPYEDKKTKEILYDSEGYYKRKLLTNGLAIRYLGDGYEINSTTGYQYLNDEMNMDQDYTNKSVFQINQRQNENSLSQEFTIKSNSASNYQWSNGIFGFYDYLKTTPPVYMMEDGINHMLQPNVDYGMKAMMDMLAQIAAGSTVNFLPAIPDKAKFTDETIDLNGLYRNSTHGAAVFHQSTYNNLFTDGLSVTLGTRLDYEKTKLDYNASAQANFNLLRDAGFIILPNPQAPPVPVPALVKPMVTKALIDGVISNDFIEFLPKGVLKYQFNNRSHVYISASRGYKTGGHNIQMFADLLQEALDNDMKKMTMEGILEEVPPGITLPQMPGGGTLPTQTKNIDERISYKPEYSWNYEVGAQVPIIEDILAVNFAAYYMDVKDVQITQFVSSVSGRPSGRMVANAGKARSQGLELGVKIRPCTGVYIYSNYGFSDAKFKKYDDGNGNDYSNNSIPFAPRSTFSLGGSVTYNTKKCTFIEKITLDTNFAAIGKIYWNEANTKSQGFYGTIDARLALGKGIFTIEFWGKNLLNRDYDTFLFTSKDVTMMPDPANPSAASVDYGQKGKPIRLGATLKIKL